jgi:hypothetical protein
LPSGIVGNVSTWSYQDHQFIGVLTGIGGLDNDKDGIGAMLPKSGNDSEKQSVQPANGSLQIFSLPDQ